MYPTKKNELKTMFKIIKLRQVYTYFRLDSHTFEVSNFNFHQNYKSGFTVYKPSLKSEIYYTFYSLKCMPQKKFQLMNIYIIYILITINKILTNLKLEFHTPQLADKRSLRGCGN